MIPATFCGIPMAFWLLLALGAGWGIGKLRKQLREHPEDRRARLLVALLGTYLLLPLAGCSAVIGYSAIEAETRLARVGGGAIALAGGGAFLLSIGAVWEWFTRSAHITRDDLAHAAGQLWHSKTLALAGALAVTVGFGGLEILTIAGFVTQRHKLNMPNWQWTYAFVFWVAIFTIPILLVWLNVWRVVHFASPQKLEEPKAEEQAPEVETTPREGWVPPSG